MASEKVWFTQCDLMGIVPNKDLIEWRKGVSSYEALCHFLVTIQPLIGIWVYQNPKLGNVVYVWSLVLWALKMAPSFGPQSLKLLVILMVLLYSFYIEQRKEVIIFILAKSSR